MAQQNKSNSLTEGSVARGMLLFAIPIFISNLFQQLYNAADSLIVGNFLGGEALAAVGSSGSLIFLLTGFVNGVALGAGVLIARYFGAKDWESLEKAIHTTVALGLAAGAVLTVVGVILTPQILHWMGTPEDVIGNSVAYFRTYFLGSIAVVMYNVGASILQSVGNSRSPMKYLIAASLINIVLDLLFIGVLGYGVAAAAFATIISQSVSAILAFSKLMRSKEAWAVSWRKVRFDGPHAAWRYFAGPALRHPELGHLAGKCYCAGKHQLVWRTGHGRVRLLQQGGRFCFPAGHLLFDGTGHFCQPECGCGQT